MWGVGVGGTVVGEGWAWGCTRVGSVGTPAYPMHPIADGRVGETSGRGQNSKDIRVEGRVEGRVYSTATHSAVKRVAPISLARPASSPHAVWVRLTSALSTPHCTFAWLCRTNRVDFVELLLRNTVSHCAQTTQHTPTHLRISPPPPPRHRSNLTICTAFDPAVSKGRNRIRLMYPGSKSSQGDKDGVW